MEFNQERIEAAIIAEAVDKIIGNDEIYERAKTQIEARVDKLWRDTAEARIRSEVELAIAAGFEREYQKTDAFGRGAGEKTSIRAELEKLIGGYWNVQVGRDGKPTDYNGTTRAEWMMAKLCADDFGKEMKQHVVNVAGSLKDHFRQELYSSVNHLLSEVFHVKTEEDKGNGRHIISPPAKPIGTA